MLCTSSGFWVYRVGCGCLMQALRAPHRIADYVRKVKSLGPANVFYIYMVIPTCNILASIYKMEAPKLTLTVFYLRGI